MNTVEQLRVLGERESFGSFAASSGRLRRACPSLRKSIWTEKKPLSSLPLHCVTHPSVTLLPPGTTVPLSSVIGTVLAFVSCLCRCIDCLRNVFCAPQDPVNIHAYDWKTLHRYSFWGNVFPSISFLHCLFQLVISTMSVLALVLIRPRDCSNVPFCVLFYSNTQGTMLPNRFQSISITL